MKTLREPATSVCLECGGRNVIDDPESGEIVCSECGRARRVPGEHRHS